MYIYIKDNICRDHFVYAPSQWGTTLHRLPLAGRIANMIHAFPSHSLPLHQFSSSGDMMDAIFKNVVRSTKAESKLGTSILMHFSWSLRWRHNDHAGVSNHQPRGCLLNRLFRRKSKKTSKLRVTGLCAGNSPGTGEFPAQMASYAENVSIWWRHHDTVINNQPTWYFTTIFQIQVMLSEGYNSYRNEHLDN